MRRVAQAAGGRAAVRLGRQAGAHRVLVKRVRGDPDPSEPVGVHKRPSRRVPGRGTPHPAAVGSKLRTSRMVAGNAGSTSARCKQVKVPLSDSSLVSEFVGFLGVPHLTLSRLENDDIEIEPSRGAHGESIDMLVELMLDAWNEAHAAADARIVDD